MENIYDIKIKRIKLFFNKKNYFGMQRGEYLKYLMKKNPDEYKTFIITEYSDEMIVYTSWYIILLILSALMILISLLVNHWYLFLGLSIITLILSKLVKNKLGKMLTGIKILFELIDIMIKKNN